MKQTVLMAILKPWYGRVLIHAYIRSRLKLQMVLFGSSWKKIRKSQRVFTIELTGKFKFD
jgi:hypothetical protein